MIIIEQPTPTPTPEPTPPPQPTPTPGSTPPYNAKSDPNHWGLTTAKMVDKIETGSYQRADEIEFSSGSDYTELAGVIGFRSNNYRQNAAYGTAQVSSQTLSEIWNVPTGEMPKGEGGSGTWTGSGWTGQPILVEWPEQTRQIMNMYDWAKEKDGLVEVIYATMDGYVYFLDIESGEATRDSLYIGMPFKGAGALDPRGYPILYLGSGDSYPDDDSKITRAMAYSLIDFTRLFEFGKKSDFFSLRAWHAYDSSPLVDAETDTLIYPGENGILYTVHLNTVYDEEAGTLSMNPDEIVKFRYSAARTGETAYWLGYEGSAAVWNGFIYLTDNSGLCHCVDLNTMQVKWVQDVDDDVNASPALEVISETEAYLYFGNTLDNTIDAHNQGTTSIFKIDAMNGNIVWKYSKTIGTTKNVTGGVMGSVILGEGDISNLVITSFASYDGETNEGEMVALDRETGSLVWSRQLSAYAWSSPIAIYTSEGKSYIVQGNNHGNLYLIEGSTGMILDTLRLGGNMEASPAAFNEFIVIGTRSKGIFGVRIS
ncbi:MAG: PQQ-binding-like beta-propeller repeat protein [Clostridia bacterium]|nr:PQQ-binding-like beta-propeller repeat protein [Clostridia bacterium]